MATSGIINTDWSGFCTPGGHGPAAMILGRGDTTGVHIFGNSIIVEPGCTASISYSGRWKPFRGLKSNIGAVTMELVDDQGKVWASSTGQVTSRSQYSSVGAGAEAVPGRLPLGTSYRIMATVHDGTMCPPENPNGKLVIDARGRPALKTAVRGGPNLPHDATPVRFHKKVHTRMTKFGLKVRIWPKKRGKKSTHAQKRARADFAKMVKLVKEVPSWDRGAAAAIAHNSGWTYRDVLSKAVTGTLWSVPGMEAAALPFILDALSSVEGAILYRGPDGWVGMAPGADGDVIVYHGNLPTVQPASALGLGMTQLHGAVSAGPGTGNQLATITASGVIAGSYHHCTLQVTADGRIIDAINGANATTGSVGLVKPDGSTITVTPDGTITATATSPPIATTTVNGISHPDGTTITIDGTGKMSGAASAISQLTGDVTAGPGSGSQAATLAASGVTAGSYTWSNISVDAKGRVTSAVSGVTPSGTEAEVLIGTVSLAGAAVAAFNSIGSYHSYALRVKNALPNTNGATIGFRVRTGATPTPQTTNYKGSYRQIGSGGFESTVTNDSGSSVMLVTGAANSGAGAITNALIAQNLITGTTAQRSSDGHVYSAFFGGDWDGSTTVTGYDIVLSTGTWTSGEVSLYGLTS